MSERPSQDDLRQLVHNREVFLQARTHFVELIELSADQRSERLESLTKTSPSLARLVQFLLNQDANDDRFLTGESMEVERWIGRDLGEFRLLRLIGSGGSGLVFMGISNQDGKRVAVKLLRGALYAPHSLKRFEQERTILHDLDHPSVCRLLDAGQTQDGTPYLVMDLIEGKPITEHCDAAKLSIRQRIQLMADVCDGVQHAHEQLIAHRDLKPSNIMVTPEGVTKVLDFGIAKLMESDEQVTTTGARQLTRKWASPEQLAGLRTSAATDVYSLGLILYDLLTRSHVDHHQGEVPAETVLRLKNHPVLEPSKKLAAIPMSQLAAIAHQRSTSANSLKRQLTGDLDAITAKCLRFDARHRYSSASGLADDLRRYLDGLPVKARSGNFTYRCLKGMQRHKWSLSAFVLVALVWVTSLMVSVAKRKQLELERDRASAVSNLLVRSFEMMTPVTPGYNIGSYQNIVDEAVNDILPQLHENPLASAELLISIGTAYRNLGLYHDGQAVLEKAIVLLDANDASDLSMRARLELGRIFVYQGEHDKAIQHAQTTIQLASDPLTEALARKLLGTALDRQGKSGDAIRELRHAYETVDQSGLVNTSITQALAHALSQAGELKESLQLVEKAVEQSAEIYGEDHANHIEALSNYVDVLWAAGNYREAEPHARRALEGFFQLYGANHPLVARATGGLAQVLDKLDRFEEATTAYHDAIETTSLILGSQHPDTLSLRNNLGILLERTGDFQGAIAFHRENLNALLLHFGPGHQDVAMSRNNLAAVMVRCGDFNTPLTLYDQALNEFETLHGANHPLVAMVCNNLGSLYWMRGELNESEPLLQRSLTIVHQTLGEHHPYAGTLSNNLGLIAFDKGLFEQAQTYQRRAIRIAEKADSATSQAQAHFDLANTLMGMGKMEQADTHARTALKLRQTILDQQHCDLAHSRIQIAKSHLRANQLEEAVVSVNQAIHSLRSLTSRDRYHVRALLEAAQVLVAAGHLENALEYAVEAFEHAQKIYPPSSWRIAYAAIVLAELKAESGNEVDATMLFSKYFGQLRDCCGPDSQANTHALRVQALLKSANL